VGPCRGGPFEELGFQVFQIQCKGENVGVGDVDRLQCLRDTMLKGEGQMSASSELQGQI